MEARTVTATSAKAIAEWCGGVLVTEIDALDPTVTAPGINVHCGADVRRASVGDVVIWDRGLFHVVKY